MTKALLIDLTKCMGCYNCVLACKDEYVENDWPPYSKSQPHEQQFWMKLREIERGKMPKVRMNYVVTPCMHCDNAPCMKAATGGAVTKRDDGIVLIDPVKSVGQAQLVASCPYGAIYWNDALNIPQKCTLCAHLLDKGWKEPRCVKACPTEAITYGEYETLKNTIMQKGAVPMHPEFATKPRVHYVGLPKTFIAGAVVDKNTDECVKGADISATDLATLRTITAKSDFFGDFWIDGLEPKRTYKVTIAKAGGASVTRLVTLYKDTDLGGIRL